MPADQTGGTPWTPTTDTCRCGCGQPATEYGVASFQDWQRLPKSMRLDVYDATQDYPGGYSVRFPGLYRVTIDAIAKWLAEHPRVTTGEAQ